MLGCGRTKNCVKKLECKRNQADLNQAIFGLLPVTNEGFLLQLKGFCLVDWEMRREMVTLHRIKTSMFH